MFGIGTTELIVILVIGMVIFGAGRLPALGKGLGQGIRGFRDALRGDPDPVAASSKEIVEAPAAAVPATTTTAAATAPARPTPTRGRRTACHHHHRRGRSASRAARSSTAGSAARLSRARPREFHAKAAAMTSQKARVNHRPRRA